MIDTVDNWILSQPSLVNKSKKALWPVVVQRQVLADGLAKYLGMLGLERRQKELTWSDLKLEPKKASQEDDDEPQS